MDFHFDTAIGAIKENVAIAKGEHHTTGWTDLPVVNLSELEPDFEFETPGLHKRVRACIGALIGRSGDNVMFDWAHVCIKADSGYYDYDRVYVAEFSTQGSTWGSLRGAVVRIIWAKHISGGGTIDDEPLYVDGLGMYGAGTDSSGVPSVAFRLFIPASVYEREKLHSEVQSLWDDLVKRATDEIMEYHLCR